MTDDIKTSIHIDRRCSTIIIEMPYMADVSVNHAYNQGSARYGIKAHVAGWLSALRATANRLITAIDDGVIAEPITLDLEIAAPHQRGRLPDTSNFRKLIQDTLAAALGVDDVIFGGTDTPARRVKNDEEPCIKIELEWHNAK